MSKTDTSYYEVHNDFDGGSSVFFKSEESFLCDEDIIGEAINQGKLDTDEYVDYVEEIDKKLYKDMTGHI